MINFYKNSYRNKIKRVMTLILTMCLLVTNRLPAYAELGNVTGTGGDGPTGDGAIGGTSINRSAGGYRFNLIFLKGDEGSGKLSDRAGNVNIDEWTNESKNIVDFGTLDVYLDGMDSQSNQYFDGSAFHFDYATSDNHKQERADWITDGGSRKMISTSELLARDKEYYHYIKDGTFDFSWQINKHYGKPNIGDILYTLVKDENGNYVEATQDLYPSVPNSHVYKGNKCAPTPECATIISTLCQKNIEGMNVKCQSVVGEGNIKPTDSVFESGTYYNKETGKMEHGSYRLLVEPYEIINVDGMGTMALTLRDSLWLCNLATSNIKSSLYDSKWGGLLANNVGGDLCLMANATYMPDKDIFSINNHIPYQDVEYLSQLTKLTPFNKDSFSSNRARMMSLNTYINGDNTNNRFGYGIGSLTSDMCKVVAHDMFIGQVTHVFLPGTLPKEINKTNDVVAYSMEYRGNKVDRKEESFTYIEGVINELTNALENVIEPKDLDKTKKAIIDTNSLFEGGKLTDESYQALTNAITDEIEDSYKPDTYSDDVKALAKDIIKDNNFKEFISQIYYQNAIGIGYASEDKTSLYEGPLKDWVRMLVIQSMINNGTLDTSTLKDTALGVLAKDLGNIKIKCQK